MKSEENASPSYSRIPNRVFEWLYGPEHDLTLRQVKVLLLVFRCTYGFNRRTAPLSRRFVSRQTGIDERDCSRTLSGLVDAGYLSASCTRKTTLYTILPRRYKNKKNHWVDDICGGDSPHGGCFTTVCGGDLPPDIERKEKGGIPTSELEAAFASLADEHDALSGGSPFEDDEEADDRPLDHPAALLDAFKKALRSVPKCLSEREAYLASVGMNEEELEAVQALLSQMSTGGISESASSTGGVAPESPHDPLFDQVI